MTFDPTKPVQTRDGRKARIICTDFKGFGRGSIIANVICTYANAEAESIYVYYDDGRTNRSSDSSLDLINVPETRRVHIIEYGDGSRWYRDGAPLDGHGGTYLGYLEYTDDQLKK